MENQLQLEAQIFRLNRIEKKDKTGFYHTIDGFSESAGSFNVFASDSIVEKLANEELPARVTLVFKIYIKDGKFAIVLDKVV